MSLPVDHGIGEAIRAEHLDDRHLISGEDLSIGPDDRPKSGHGDR